MGHPSGAPDFCVYCGAIGGDMQEVDIGVGVGGSTQWACNDCMPKAEDKADGGGGHMNGRDLERSLRGEFSELAMDRREDEIAELKAKLKEAKEVEMQLRKWTNSADEAEGILRAERDEALAKLAEAKKRSDLFADCLQRAKDRWVAAHPEKDYWPDGADNIVWLLEKLARSDSRVALIHQEFTCQFARAEKAEAERDEAQAACAAYRDGLEYYASLTALDDAPPKTVIGSSELQELGVDTRMTVRKMHLATGKRAREVLATNPAGAKMLAVVKAAAEWRQAEIEEGERPQPCCPSGRYLRAKASLRDAIEALEVEKVNDRRGE